MDNGFAIKVLLATILMVVIYSIFHAYRYKARNVKLQILSKHFKSSIQHRFYDTPTLKGEFEGREYWIKPGVGRQSSPPYLTIRMKHHVPFIMWVCKKGGLFSGLQQFGGVGGTGAQELIKTGDQLFDEQFRVYSNQVNQVKGYLEPREMRDTIRALFTHGFESILLDSQWIRFEKRNYDLEADLEISKVSSILQQLSSLPTGNELSGKDAHLPDSSTAARYNTNLLSLCSYSILFVFVGCFLLMGSTVSYLSSVSVTPKVFFAGLFGAGLLGFGVWVSWYCQKMKIGK